MKCLMALLFGALSTGAFSAPVPDTLWIDSLDGTRLRVLSAGTGDAIVFVPGWTMTAEIWQGQFDALSEKHRVISFDPRGQGQSSKPAHGYDSKRRAKDIHAILVGLNLEKAVLVGWSLGAIDALNYLQIFGAERLRGVVLVDNSLDKHFSSGPMGLRLLEQLRTRPYEDVIHDFVPGLFATPPSEARLLELGQWSLLTPAFAAREALGKASSGEGFAAAVTKTGLQALYLVTPRFAEEGRKLKEALGARFSYEVFEKSGHAIFVDDAQRFNQRLESFIQQLP